MISTSMRLGSSKKQTCRPPKATAGLGCETITDPLSTSVRTAARRLCRKSLVVHLDAPREEGAHGRFRPQRLDQLDLHRAGFHEQAADDLPRVLENLPFPPKADQLVLRDLVFDPLAGDSNVVKDQIV